MKIVTWNVNHRKDASPQWKFLTEKFKPDIVILQEYKSAIAYPQGELITAGVEIETENYEILWESVPHWGTSIISRSGKITPLQIKETNYEHGKTKKSYLGRLIGATVKSTSYTIDVFNLHVPITKGYSRYNLEKMISFALNSKENAFVIIAGDFNFGDTFDGPDEADCKDFFNSLLANYELIDAYKLFNAKSVQTFRSARKPEAIHHLDHFLVSANLKEFVSNSGILKSPWELSDHRPIFVELKNVKP